MSKVRGKFEKRSVLDFSKGKVSKNRIRQALRQWDVPEVVFENDDRTYIDNYIQIGMYEICIIPRMKSSWKFLDNPKTKLKDYGGFTIEIFEKRNGELKTIDCRKDNRFKEQNWAPIAYTYNVRMKHLLDMIFYCNRLDNLRVFL